MLGAFPLVAIVLAQREGSEAMGISNGFAKTADELDAGEGTAYLYVVCTPYDDWGYVYCVGHCCFPSPAESGGQCNADIGAEALGTYGLPLGGGGGGCCGGTVPSDDCLQLSDTWEGPTNTVDLFQPLVSTLPERGLPLPLKPSEAPVVRG